MQHILFTGTGEVLLSTQRSSYILTHKLTPLFANLGVCSVGTIAVFYPTAQIWKDFKAYELALFLSKMKKKISFILSKTT